ncbi:hypothetical protein MHY1_03247 [Methylovirgula sp. HY1]|nr:hypothetical protein MHY1_03247 [Methylovirgula sp. HY1]
MLPLTNPFEFKCRFKYLEGFTAASMALAAARCAPHEDDNGVISRIIEIYGKARP